MVIETAANLDLLELGFVVCFMTYVFRNANKDTRQLKTQDDANKYILSCCFSYSAFNYFYSRTQKKFSSNEESSEVRSNSQDSMPIEKLEMQNIVNLDTQNKSMLWRVNL